MSNAFAATYSDWKVIKGRKVVQVVLELALENSDSAYKVLGGMPNPAAEIWVGVAPLPKVGLSSNEGPGEARDDSLKSESHALTTSETTGTAAGSPTGNTPSRTRSQDAHWKCNLPSFRVYLEQRRRHAIPTNNHINNMDEAKHVLRAWLEIESLSELDRNPSAANRWEQIEANYKRWLTEPDVERIINVEI